MLNAKTEIILVVVHLLIGVLVYAIPPLSTLYEFLIIGVSLFLVIKNENRNEEVLIAAAYIAGSDVFLRMTGGILSSEMHKYMIIILMVVGLFLKNSSARGFSYLVYLLLLLPGVVFTDYLLEQEIRKLIAFNLGGPVCLGVTAFYLYKKRLSFKKMNQVLFALMLPILSMVVYVIFYNPSVRDVIRDTTSNHAASGGFGPNQVATIMGIAMFVIVAKLLVYRSKMNILILNLVLLSIVSFRALVTFSRGGVLTAVVAIGALMVILQLYGGSVVKKRMFTYLFLMSIAFSSTWLIASSKTDGIIDKRYSNQDVSGKEKEDISTGRVDIINVEIEAFLENPTFGIGVGNSKKYRFERTGINAASHNEFTRTLAEHGSFGIMALLILLLQPFILRVSNRKNPYFYSLILIWFLTLSHSATRIAAPSLIYGLALVDIYYEKTSIRRKQLKEE